MGSVGELACTIKPHKLRPHGLIRIFAPSFASHWPTGEAGPVSQVAAQVAAARIADNVQCMNAPKMALVRAPLTATGMDFDHFELHIPLS